MRTSSTLLWNVYFSFLNINRSAQALNAHNGFFERRKYYWIEDEKLCRHSQYWTYQHEEWSFQSKIDKYEVWMTEQENDNIRIIKNQKWNGENYLFSLFTYFLAYSQRCCQWIEIRDRCQRRKGKLKTEQTNPMLSFDGCTLYILRWNVMLLFVVYVDGCLSGKLNSCLENGIEWHPTKKSLERHFLFSSFNHNGLSFPVRFCVKFK